jgi:hypothetical protein
VDASSARRVEIDAAVKRALNRNIQVADGLVREDLALLRLLDGEVDVADALDVGREARVAEGVQRQRENRLQPVVHVDPAAAVALVLNHSFFLHQSSYQQPQRAIGYTCQFIPQLRSATTF